METLKLKIGGMSCGGCVQSVRKAVESVPDTEVLDLNIGELKVKTPGRATADRVLSAIADAGFEVTSFEAVAN